MLDDDFDITRPVPRNVPKLTDVVRTDGEDEALDTQAPVSAPAPLSEQSLALSAQAVLELIGPELDAQISRTIGRVLHEQMLGLNARVQKAVAEVVREAVTQALTRPAGGDGPAEP